GGMASVKRVQDILKEVEVPPLKVSRSEASALRAESMPLFSAKVLDNYLAEDAATPFRDAVKKAKEALNKGVKGKRLREEFSAPQNLEAFNKDIKNYQEKELADVQS